MVICSGAMTDTGRVRPANEDNFLVDEGLGLFLVADGMGGSLAGEVASRMAVESIRASIAESASRGVERGDYPSRNAARLALAVELANRDIHEASHSRADWQGMGTTVAAVLLEGFRLTVAHAGDSRVYLIRGGAIVRLTEDHSMVMEQVRQGALAPEEAALSPCRNIITRALGPLPMQEAETSEADLMDGDRLLLCSDGLTGKVTDDEILTLLKGAADPTAACGRLVALANERGGDDNITVVAVFLAEKGCLPRFFRWSRR